MTGKLVIPPVIALLLLGFIYFIQTGQQMPDPEEIALKTMHNMSVEQTKNIPEAKPFNDSMHFLIYVLLPIAGFLAILTALGLLKK